ncbi:MAG: zinc ribbon domain-containing protein [Planctomycetota bacterium]
MSDWVPCPTCGADIRADASFCRHCGASDSDDWNEDGDWEEDHDEFDYDEFVQNEFGQGEPGQSVTNTNTAPIWRLVAVILLIMIALGYLMAFGNP